MSSLSLSDSIRGALLGSACGDALGAPAEFKSQAEVKKRWGVLRDMVGGGAWAPGEWTDDTGMALCVAEGILENPDEPVEPIGRRFLEWRKTAKDVGTTISAALSGYRGDWEQAARNSPQARESKAAGNGSLMRTLPIALAYSDPDKMLRVSAQVSALTHWDPQAEMCCVIYCAWIRELLAGKGMREAWRAALTQGRKLAKPKSLAPHTPGLEPLPVEFWPRLESVEKLKYEQLQPSGYAGYVVECLEAAAWCCLNGDSLEDTLIKVVNLAGEADTMAAVAGGAAGASWGVGAIPSRWLHRLHERDRIERVAVQLAHLRRHGEVYSRPDLPKFNWSWIEQSRLMAGRNPLTAWDVDFLVAQGITHILDLREPWEWALPRDGQEALDEIERQGLVRVHMPVEDMGGPTRSTIEAACEFIDRALAQPGAAVYIHCRAGNERTGSILVAWYGRRHSLPYGQALAALRQKRSTINPLLNQRRAIETWLEQIRE